LGCANPRPCGGISDLAPVSIVTQHPTLITVEGIRIFAKHGVFAHEKTQDQLFVIDLFVTLAAPPVEDDLNTTVDYSGLVKLVVEIFAEPPVNLIETLAQQVADRVLQVRNVASAKVVVRKPTVQLDRPVSDVSVTVQAAKP
jgi:dihydroneopterin aldolase